MGDDGSRDYKLFDNSYLLNRRLIARSSVEPPSMGSELEGGGVSILLHSQLLLRCEGGRKPPPRNRGQSLVTSGVARTPEHHLLADTSVTPRRSLPHRHRRGSWCFDPRRTHFPRSNPTLYVPRSHQTDFIKRRTYGWYQLIDVIATIVRYSGPIRRP